MKYEVVAVNCIHEKKTWYHIVITFKKHPDLAGIMRSFFLNGKPIILNHMSAEQFNTMPCPEVGHLVIGRNGLEAVGGVRLSGISDQSFNGSLKYLAMWSKTLTPIEVQSIYESGVKEISESLIAYWPFTKSTKCSDVGPKKLHGTSVGYITYIGKIEPPTLLDICLNFFRCNPLLLNINISQDLLNAFHKKILFLPDSYNRKC